MEPKVFLITGASGFLGYHLCKHLTALGQVVKGIDVEDFDYPDIAGKVSFHKGDIRDRTLLRDIMRGVQVVVHGAAALPLWPKEEILSVNVEGTRAVGEVAHELGIERVVHISSTAVYGIPKKHPVDENHPLDGVGPYGKTKIEAEAICTGLREKGMCVPILRPKTFAGPMRLGVFQILCDWVRDGRNIPIIGNGHNRYQLLHVDDLVEAICLVSTAHPDKANDTFNVGATTYETMKADLQTLMDYAGFGKHVLPIPAWLVIPVLKILERLHLSPLYEWVYETAGQDHCVSVDKLQSEFGWVPRRTTADVWIDTYKWYLQEFETRPLKTGITHRVAWKQGILSPVRRFF